MSFYTLESLNNTLYIVKRRITIFMVAILNLLLLKFALIRIRKTFFLLFDLTHRFKR